MKKLQNNKLAIIEWEDAAIHGSSSLSRKEAEECGLIKGFAVGILVKEDKKQITIAMDWFSEDDQFRSVSSYPKSGIKKIIKQEFGE